MAGALLPLVALLARPGLRRIDHASEPPSLALLAMTTAELLRALSPTTQEKLVARSVVSTMPSNEVIVRQGDPADRFYVIVSGDVQVTVDGTPVRVSSAGECFGETGLMRRAPRNATVRALTEVCVMAVDGQAFVDAVTGNSDAFSATAQVIDGYSAGDPSSVMSSRHSPATSGNGTDQRTGPEPTTPPPSGRTSCQNDS